MTPDDAAVACRRAAAAVDDAADARARAADGALARWRGPARDRFEAELARVQREARALAEELRAAAVRAQAADTGT